MSNDRHDDERVSATYKRLATERTPEHLDRTILAMAAKNAKKPAYSRWIRWSRPAAWAATITLCLAISLELARDPALDMSAETISPASAPVLDERKRDNDARNDAIEQNLANEPDSAIEQDRLEPDELVKDRYSTKEERSMSIKPADLERQHEVAESIAESAAFEKTSLARSASKQSFDEPATVVAEPESDVQKSNIMMQSAPAVEEVLPAPARAMEAEVMSGATMADEFAAYDSTCSVEVRSNADDWLDCIKDLETNGLHDAATAERELLIDTFPDFKLP